MQEELRDRVMHHELISECSGELKCNIFDYYEDLVIT